MCGVVKQTWRKMFPNNHRGHVGLGTFGPIIGSGLSWRIGSKYEEGIQIDAIGSNNIREASHFF